MRSLLLSLGLVVGLPSYAAQTETLTGPVPDVVQSFEETLARYRARVAEIEAGALAALQAQKAEQLAVLTGSYDRHLVKLEDDLIDRRRMAIAKFEEFLVRYEDLAWGSDVRLRLAELLFQDAQEKWLQDSKSYDAAVEAAGDDLDKLAMVEAMGEPVVELGRVSELLQRIISDNRELPREQQYELLDVAYYMLAFCYSDENSDKYDRELARSTFRELVKVRADSEYSDAAHLLLGNYAFEDNDLRAAIVEFQEVMSRGPERRHYSAAMYQLAWTRYKLSEYREATRLFVQLLDESDEGVKRGRRASDYANDAITYLSLSLSDEADRMDDMLTEEREMTPMRRTAAFFRELGAPRAYEWDVMRTQGEQLVRYDRDEDAIEVYRALVERPEFANRPENPELHATLVSLMTRGYYADVKAAGEERIRMSQIYGEGSDWWNANRANPEAQAKARKYIESLLLAVAKEVKVRATEAEPPDPALFSQAADKYREYLEKFPISDNFFANQFQMADALYQAQRLDEAVAAYSDLLRNERFHPYGDISVYQLMRARQQVMLDRVGPSDKPVADAEVERTYTSVGGAEIKVMHLEEEQKRFIEVIDLLLARRCGEAVEGMDVAPLVEGNRVKLMYIAGQILFYANRYEEARPRLQDLINRFPRTDEAAWAANLLLTTYINEKDSEQIRRWSRELYTLRLGATAAEVEAKAEQFRNTLERATFELGQRAASAGQHEEAAQAYLAFIEEFPKSEYVPVALLNAAGSYEQAGRTADANDIYERFIKAYPEHPEAKQLFYRIASNYEATFELDKSIAIYQELVDRYPQYELSPDALYMTAFLKEGLGDKLGAAQGYETYAKKYPEKSDRETVHFRAGALYEEVDTERAIRFYRGYLSQYGTTNGDHAITAQYRIARLLQEQGKTRESSLALDEVVAMFDRVTAAGTPVGPEARDQAAEAAFRPLQALHDKVLAYKLVGSDTKDAATLEAQLVDMEKLAAEAGPFITKYLSFEYSSAALYLAGSASAAYARLGLSLEPPAELVDDERDVYWQMLEENIFPSFYPYEEGAIATLEQAVTLGREQGRHSVWIDRAWELLNRIKPEKYPAAKRTLLGSDEVTGVPALTPMLPPAMLPPEQARGPDGTQGAGEGGGP